MANYRDFKLKLPPARDKGSIYVEYGTCCVCKEQNPCLKVYIRDANAQVCSPCIGKFFESANRDYRREYGEWMSRPPLTI